MSDIIVKYMAKTGYSSSLRIERKEFVRETDGYFFDAVGRKHAKSSKYGVYFDTWAEAHAELVRVADANRYEAGRILELAQSYVDNVRAMKEPTV